MGCPSRLQVWGAQCGSLLVGAAVQGSRAASRMAVSSTVCQLRERRRAMLAQVRAPALFIASMSIALGFCSPHL